MTAQCNSNTAARVGLQSYRHRVAAVVQSAAECEHGIPNWVL